MSLLVFGLLALGATGRLTRLLTADKITEPLRHWVIQRTRTTTAADRASYFVTCPWCVSMWVAPPVIALGWWPAHAGSSSWWWFPTACLLVSYLVGLLASLDD
jgi:hypothetical protein